MSASDKEYLYNESRKRKKPPTSLVNPDFGYGDSTKKGGTSKPNTPPSGWMTEQANLPKMFPTYPHPDENHKQTVEGYMKTGAIGQVVPDKGYYPTNRPGLWGDDEKDGGAYVPAYPTPAPSSPPAAAARALPR